MTVQCHQPTLADSHLLLTNGQLVDGTGEPSRSADIRIAHGEIVEVGRSLARGDAKVIDVDGLVVTPGFIDLHAHSEGPLLHDPYHHAKVAQGVTFELLGQDGLGFAPVDSPEADEILRTLLEPWHGPITHLDDDTRSIADLGRVLQDRGVAINIGMLVPHGTIRLCAVGEGDDEPSSDQMARMRALLVSGLQDGAFGLSTGLAYAPARFASTKELVELCSLMDRDSLFVPHLRDYGKDALASYAEGVSVAKRSDVSLHLTHAVLNGPTNKGAARDLIALVHDSAVERVSFDVYPYAAGSTYLHVFLPPWITRHPHRDQLAMLSDAESRSRLYSHLVEVGIQWDRLVIAGVQNDSLVGLVGRSIAELASSEDSEPIDVYCRILRDDEFGTTCVRFNGHQENIDTLLLGHPRTAIASDSLLVGQAPHPRGYGTFARFIECYVNEGAVSVEEGVRRITGLPADILGMEDRGIISVGSVADVACFDPALVRERATFEDPRQLATGFTHVFVGGTAVLLDGEPTDQLPGRFVRRSRSTPGATGPAVDDSNPSAVLDP